MIKLDSILIVNLLSNLMVENKTRKGDIIMGFNFKQVAQENTLLSAIMAGKDKLETDDVLDQELTIVGFDFAPKFDQHGNTVVDENGEVDTFGVVVFSEYPDKYYCVGAVFTKVCHAWAAGFKSPKEASDALAAEGGVKVKFSASKTRKGNNLTAVEILN